MLRTVNCVNNHLPPNLFSSSSSSSRKGARKNKNCGRTKVTKTTPTRASSSSLRDETTNNTIGKMSENVHLNSQFTNSSGISNKNDGDVVIQDDLTEMLSIVPEDVREKISKHAHRSKLLEIVLDLGRQPEARFSGMEDVKKQSETLRDDVVTQEELDHAERVVGEFGGDNRAGVTGTLHRISCIRNRSGEETK